MRSAPINGHRPTLRRTPVLGWESGMRTETKHKPAESEQPENPSVLEQKTNKGKTASVVPAVAEQNLPEMPVAELPARGPTQMILMASLAILCVALALFAWRLHRSKAPVSAVSTASERLVSLPESLPHAPGVVASEDELVAPWSSKRFTYRDPIIGTDVPAMVVRLPDGSYWGFSLVDPIRHCQLEFVTDVNRLQSFYHLQADHPMVGDPCNFAVFDLLQYSGPRDAEVRGAPVNGIGVRPPIAIEIEQNGKEILATKIE